MDVEITINLNAYHQLGSEIKLPDKPPAIITKATADTGAQTCTSGTHILRNIPNCWLLPTSHNLKGVDNNSLHINGVLIVDITSSSGTTTELLYVCEKVSGIYISQSALKKMKIIKETFPETRIATVSNDVNPTTSRNVNPDLTAPPTDTTALAPCGCPLRKDCPQRPDKLPFPATADHREELEDWIKQYYSASAFNTCPHQELQVMKSEPLKIAFKPDYAPRAIHKPIPIPHHWKEKVKSQLDADVALGIIEPVPQGVPTQ